MLKWFLEPCYYDASMQQKLTCAIYNGKLARMFKQSKDLNWQQHPQGKFCWN